MSLQAVAKAALSVGVLGLSLSCQTKRDDSSSSVKDGTLGPPPAEILAGFEKSCMFCHSKYKDLATGHVSWTKITANATKIVARLDPANHTPTSMPPDSADDGQQLDSDLKTKMFLAVKPFATTTGAGTPGTPSPTTLPLHKIKLPPGFKIALYAVVPHARSMVLSPSGTLFVGTGGFSDPDTKVYAVRDNDGDHFAEQVQTILTGLDNPNGVAVRDGALYVAERYRILRYKNIESHLANPGAPAVLFSDFLHEFTNHAWKYIAFGPDGKLYVPVGSACNICNPDTELTNGAGRFARIFRMNPDGTGWEEFAKGIRNSVGFAWHPDTKELWFTDNGRDSLGDDIPPDELNRAPTAGLDFGFPRCHGMGIPDPQYGTAGCTATNFVKPMLPLGAHVAALGMKFYTGSMFPAEYKNRVLIAEHGSWNSTHKVGARVTMAVQTPTGLQYKTFAEGWNDNDEFWGRPVDVLVMPDGSLLVSDDHGGAIYRITYSAP